MHAQVFVVAQAREHCIGYGTNAHLQGRAVFDHFSNVPTNLRLGIRQWMGGHLINRRLAPNHSIEVSHMYQAIPVGTWHVWVYLGDHRFGRLCCCQCRIYRDSQRGKAMLIRWRHLQQRHINRDDPSAKHNRHLTEKAGNKVRLTRGHSRPAVATDKE